MVVCCTLNRACSIGHADIRDLNDLALRAPKTGMIVLGGGLAKHHVCNANLMRNGADYSVFINTVMRYHVL